MVEIENVLSFIDLKNQKCECEQNGRWMKKKHGSIQKQDRDKLNSAR